MVFRKFAFIAALAFFTSLPASALVLSRPGFPSCQLKEPDSALPDCNNVFREAMSPVDAANAQHKQEQMCMSVSFAVERAAELRNRRFTTDATFERIKYELTNSLIPMMSDGGIMNAVTFAYFDHAAQRVTPYDIYTNAQALCMREPSIFVGVMK